MRKLTFTLLAFGSMSMAMAQIPNGDMESWNNIQWSTAPSGSGNSYDDLGPSTTRTDNFIRSINEINDIAFPLTAPATTYKCDTAHTGSYSARLTTSLFGSFIIPGFIGTGDVNIAAQNVNFGRPYTSRPASYKGWYQYFPVSGDSAAVEIWFQNAGTIIGTGKQVITSGASSWTQFDVTINWTSSLDPDTVVFLAASSGGYNLSNLTAGVGQVGSTLLVDDITLEGGNVGVEEEMMNANVHIYPNPSSDVINISTSELPAGLVLDIFDVAGRKILSRSLNNNNDMVDISALNAGNYVVTIRNESTLIHKSKLIKK